MKRLSTLLALSLGITVFAFVSATAQLSLPDTLLASLDRTSTGSGAIVSSNGYVLTNNHVIDGATTIEVVLSTGRTYEAQVIETDPDQDLALIKINGSGLPSIPIDTQRAVRVGELVVSIGSPRGLVGTVSSGTVTALNRNLNSLSLSGLYQTDTNIAPGSSGGPLIDKYGNIIGINVAVAVEGEDHVPITAFGFSIPISQAQHILRHVSNAPAPRTAALSVPDIAEMCAPATVYIICTREIPLASLLPTALPGYTDTLFSLDPIFIDSSEWPGCATLREYQNQYPSLRLSPVPPPDCWWRDTHLWTIICGSRKPAHGSIAAEVLLVDCDSLEDANQIVETERENNMLGLDVVTQGSYTVGHSSATLEIGMETYSTPAKDWLSNVTFNYTVALKGMLTLPLDDLLLVASLSWQITHIPTTSYGYVPPGPGDMRPATDINRSVDFSLQDSCIVRVNTTTYLFTPSKNTSTTITLICLDEFKDELERIFEEAVRALAAGL